MPFAHACSPFLVTDPISESWRSIPFLYLCLEVQIRIAGLRGHGSIDWQNVEELTKMTTSSATIRGTFAHKNNHCDRYPNPKPRTYLTFEVITASLVRNLNPNPNPDNIPTVLGHNRHGAVACLKMRTHHPARRCGFSVAEMWASLLAGCLTSQLCNPGAELRGPFRVCDGFPVVWKELISQEWFRRHQGRNVSPFCFL